MCGLDVARIELGETVVIQGAGGLGIFATATARELGAGRVIVIDGVQERLDLAAAFGADELIDLRELRTPSQRVERVKELTDGWGADVVVEVAGVIGAMSEALEMLGNGGRLVEIGNIVAGTSFDLAPTTLNQRNVSILGRRLLRGGAPQALARPDAAPRATSTRSTGWSRTCSRWRTSSGCWPSRTRATSPARPSSRRSRRLSQKPDLPC